MENWNQSNIEKAKKMRRNVKIVNKYNRTNTGEN